MVWSTGLWATTPSSPTRNQYPGGTVTRFAARRDLPPQSRNGKCWQMCNQRSSHMMRGLHDSAAGEDGQTLALSMRASTNHCLVARLGDLEASKRAREDSDFLRSACLPCVGPLHISRTLGRLPRPRAATSDNVTASSSAGLLSAHAGARPAFVRSV